MSNLALFQLGQIVGTPGALAALENNTRTPLEYLTRHACGDWGEVGDEDKMRNEFARASGDERILSAYTLPDGERIWIITEADRTCTTVLLPEEY